MQISTSQYGTDLTKKSDVFITEGVKPKKIFKKSRVGITKGIDKLWNFSFQI
jgi:3-methyladenine DNA glycosylase Mpg